MNYFLDIMESKLSNEDKRLLQAIYAPQVVSVPPVDACRSMVVTKEGEIRIYGAINKKEPDDVGTPVYSSSTDCGLSWKTHILTDYNMLGSAGYSRKTGRYISCYPNEYRPDLRERISESGTWAIINDEGYDSTNNRLIKLSDKLIHVLLLPFYLESCDRWFILGEHTFADGTKTVVVFYSDDNGEKWVEKYLEMVPKFETVPPHKGERWQNYCCEPKLVELSDGELLMIVRTSQNYHYFYRSKDKGTTWMGPERSDFHSTLTMPVFEKLSDGRIILFWCNTQPMPEIDHNNVFPMLSEDEKKGIWEDVFTNRDANHLAISEDDGRNWIGFRELFLNVIRNNADFRSIGGVNSRDKSVHQAQILELPYNKLLIHFGQNLSARKVVILDIGWLYERERSENFRLGLENVSTQMYVKSNLGGYRGFSGHCAYNRTNGALLVPDPDGNFEEVLQICRIEDDRLVYKKQGVVWNFPASRQGEVSVKLRILESGVRLSLTDHWYNPTDEVVRDEAHFGIDIVDKNNEWDTVTVKYDTEAGIADLGINGIFVKKLEMTADAPNGLSYLHLQTLAENEDMNGTLIKSLEKK